MPTSGRTKHHWSFWLVYLAHTLVGVLVLLQIPSSVLSDELDMVVFNLWGFFLLGGGVSSLVGSVRGYWFGELVGIPLLIGADLVYSVALWGRWEDGELSSPYQSILIFTLPILLVARFRINMKLMRLSEKVGRL